MNKRIYNKNGITLGELRSFIKDLSYLPDEVKIDFNHYIDGNDCIRDIIVDENSITFYNFL